MNKLHNFDCNTSEDTYQEIMYMVIWFDAYLVSEYFYHNQQRVARLINYFETTEKFEKCYWLAEMNKAIFLKEQQIECVYLSNYQSIIEYNRAYFKKILLRMIYFPKEDFQSRFKNLNGHELQKLITFFEDSKEFEKCYWLYEIKKHYDHECMLNISRSMPD